MGDFHDELERRIKQFTHYLTLMRERHSTLTKGHGFIIFEESLNRDAPQRDELDESKVLVQESTGEIGGFGGFASTWLDERSSMDLPTEGWRDEKTDSRFIQFSFNRRYFDMDIPNVTLWPAEAEEILQDRRGFFFVKDRRQFEHPAEDVERYNPLRKVYVYGDQRSAAEDMAYVWFQAWNFPVDWRFYVTAAAFFDKTDWERGLPIE